MYKYYSIEQSCSRKANRFSAGQEKKIHKLYAAKDRLSNEICCIRHKSLFRAAYRSRMCYYSTMNALNGVSGVRTTAMLVVPLHRIGVKNNASFLTKFRNRDVLIVRRDTRTVSTLRTVLYFYRLFMAYFTSPAAQHVSIYWQLIRVAWKISERKQLWPNLR